MSDSNGINVRVVAEDALAEILRRQAGHVYASRRGIAAGLPRARGQVVMFRREGGTVRLEVWDYGRSGQGAAKQTLYALPEDLEKLAGKMLDAL